MILFSGKNLLLKVNLLEKELTRRIIGDSLLFANPLIHPVYPRKLCIMVVFDFSWDMKMWQCCGGRKRSAEDERWIILLTPSSSSRTRF